MSREAIETFRDAIASAGRDDIPREDIPHRYPREVLDADRPADAGAEAPSGPAMAATCGPYQVMPDLAPEEYAGLKSDIQRRGIQVPILVDEDGVILDGHHRKRIADELGIECRVERREGLTEAAKRELAVALNIERRHLTREQRQNIIDGCLLTAPEKSDRAIAKLTGTSDKTVAARRRAKEATAEIPQLGARVGKDGKTRQAQKNAASAPMLKKSSVLVSIDDALERLKDDCIAIKQLHDGGKLVATDADFIARRALSLLRYTIGKLHGAERRRALHELKTLVAEHGGAA